VAEFVADDGAELLGRQGLEQREADDEMVAVPAEWPEPWDLHDAGIELLWLDDDAMHRQRPEPLTDRLNLLDQPRCTAPVDVDAGGCRDLQPQRFQHQECEEQRQERHPAPDDVHVMVMIVQSNKIGSVRHKLIDYDGQARNRENQQD